VGTGARLSRALGVPDGRAHAFGLLPFDSTSTTPATSPRFVHAWTPRENVRRFTIDLSTRLACPYVVHLEDNEYVILELALGTPAEDLLRRPEDEVVVPETPDGWHIHAVEHVHKGAGDAAHLANLRRFVTGFGATAADLDRELAALSMDIETYHLSAESHNRWRGSTPYDRFPIRVCVSVQICMPARDGW
jgi:hypothetical protein